MHTIVCTSHSKRDCIQPLEGGGGVQYLKSVTVTAEPIWIHAYTSEVKGMAVVVKGIAEPVYKSQPLQQVPNRYQRRGRGGGAFTASLYQAAYHDAVVGQHYSSH